MNFDNVGQYFRTKPYPFKLSYNFLCKLGHPQIYFSRKYQSKVDVFSKNFKSKGFLPIEDFMSSQIENLKEIIVETRQIAQNKNQICMFLV